ncbi:hypothetical protein [Paenibacillus sp. GCM10012306]|uniref:hypothetical protein n=1 Tax=Paenibacillus sp. GCM10012306 TaxID=3317342 RepID=UPI00360EA65D
MNYIVALDPQCIIWEENDYTSDPVKYSQLSVELLDFMDMIESIDNKLVLSTVIQNQLEYYFPHLDQNSDISRAIFRFLSRVSDNIIDCHNEALPGIISSPEVINYTLDTEVQSEMKKLLSYMHEYKNEEKEREIEDIVFFTIYNHNSQSLKIFYREKQNLVSILNNSGELEDLLKRSSRKFEMNPKHDPTVGWGSPLSVGVTQAQKMLNDAIASKKKETSQALYYYDFEKKVTIVFRPHTNNTYHGYENNDTESLPSDIRKEFKL